MLMKLSGDLCIIQRSHPYTQSQFEIQSTTLKQMIYLTVRPHVGLQKFEMHKLTYLMGCIYSAVK